MRGARDELAPIFALNHITHNCVILGLFIDVGDAFRAEPYHLSERRESHRQWYRRTLEEAPAPEKRDASASPMTFPELDNYQMIRPGLWWIVRTRDRWMCCSCGRSSRQEGVLLEVDHIPPRSQGGSNTMHNLQTLCRKCNQGKRDRDSTDLRQEEAEHVLGNG